MSAPAVTRAAAILGSLADEGPLTLTEIARVHGLAKSSTLNLCVALEEAGLVRRTPEGAWTLGRRTVELGGAYVRGFDVVREFYDFTASHPVLSHELLQLVLRHQRDVVYLARHEGRAPLPLSASIGDRFPASVTAVGTALLARLDDTEIRRLYAEPHSLAIWTERSPTSVEALLEKLHATRERGYAVDDRETHPQVYGVAMVVPARRAGDEPFSVGCSLMLPTLTEEQLISAREGLAELRDHLAAPLEMRG
ncbi:IclR family transcriptional regulator [Enemella evansiae]|uniref:IclR family transcriptional regulator n=1 Tax=Enemella evansiae TaxID=2016499 RepID=UPI000B96E282|nr:IclR family transcriptional regulator [Enemella evansiae]PFG67881.1 IclR family transcriptional regulator [Propionibacteriaceae bacterium ES.041]OYN93050.1 ArsR family transcriptional regulator [Enemella evansiae]OYN95905.1 ArsR family transcriptional regulator [Enemella evansiae]OYO04116.1 ArsR family transcriptional regulator [Enemella evansiae]OYO08531.1 ArsR family transcriptional regulator [Enemella evansiae]